MLNMSWIKLYLMNDEHGTRGDSNTWTTGPVTMEKLYSTIKYTYYLSNPK